MDAPPPDVTVRKLIEKSCYFLIGGGGEIGLCWLSVAQFGLLLFLQLLHCILIFGSVLVGTDHFVLQLFCRLGACWPALVIDHI